MTTPAKELQDAMAPFMDVWGPYRLTRDEVTETAIRRYCEVAHDGNPVYWDEEFARGTRFGRLIAPPQSIFSMSFAPWWSPDYVSERNRDDAERLSAAAAEIPSGAGLSDRYGYTVATVASQEVEYVAPFGPGDGRLKMRSKTTGISDEKQTGPGRGVFITTVTEYRTEKDDRLVARSTMVLLKYNPDHPRAGGQ